MNQTLKIVVPIVVLMAVIFGITFFSRYAPKEDETQTQVSSEPPLRFGSTTRMWNPVGSLQDQIFPGFYEAQADALGTKNRTSFWFENRNPSPVTLQVAFVSCTQCSGGRVAAVPPDVTRQIIEMSIISGLPQGLCSGLPVGMVGPAARLHPDRLEWQSHTFKDNPNASFTVPPVNNPDGWTPQWGMLELMFSAAPGPKTLSADFIVGVESTKKTERTHFEVTFEGVDPFELSEKTFSVGELTETSEPKKFEVLLYSLTRGPNGVAGSDLNPPSVSVELPQKSAGEPGPFVAVSAPVRVPEKDLVQLSMELSGKNGKYIRVEAAYRMTVTVNPKVGDKRVDLGPLERDIWVSVPGTPGTRSIRVSGLVRGPVWLEDNRKELRLNDKFASGTREEFRLVTQEKDAELVEVPSLRSPEGFGVELKKLPPGLERGNYALIVTVPEKKFIGAWNGTIVLELKGPNPQRIRIPVKGKGDR